jgi:hypothetical protein
MYRRNKLLFHIMLFLVIALAVSAISCKKEEPQQPQQQKPEPTALVTFVLGKVTVTSPDGTSAALSVKDEIETGAVIETGAKSFANLQIADTGMIRVDEKSRLEMKDILSADNGTVLNLKTGSAFSRVIKKLDTKYRIETPTMVASVRGTEFLTIASDKKGQVLVKEGTVNVSTSSDTEGKPVTERKRAAVDDKGGIKLAFQNKLQELTLEKYALNPYIEGAEIKSAEEIQEIYKSLNPEEKKIDKKIEETKVMMLSPLDRLRKAGKPLVELFLKDGSQIIGAIEKTTETNIKLNTGESVIEIPKADIKRRVSTK